MLDSLNRFLWEVRDLEKKYYANKDKSLKAFIIISMLLVIFFVSAFPVNSVSAQITEMRGGVNFHLDPWAKLTEIELDNHFQILRENKITHLVIVVYWNELEPKVGKYDAENMKYLKQVISVAMGKGIEVQVDLHTIMPTSSVNPSGFGENTMKIFTSSKSRNVYVKYCKWVISQLDGMGVYSISVLNEPLRQGGATPDQVVSLWKQLQSEIKIIDSSVKVTVRFSTTWMAHGFSDEQAMTLDYPTINNYLDPAEGSTAWGTTWDDMQYCVDVSHSYGKEIWLGEWGGTADPHVARHEVEFYQDSLTRYQNQGWDVVCSYGYRPSAPTWAWNMINLDGTPKDCLYVYPEFVYAEEIVDNPPIISDVGSSGVTSSSATINWVTDEVSDGLVIYGPDESLGFSVSDAIFVFDHSIVLSGLEEETTYYYKVQSTDASGNALYDDNGGFLFTFTTSDQLTVDIVISIVRDESFRRGSQYSRASATVTVLVDGFSLVEATVYGSWSGAIEDSVIGQTTGEGLVTFKTGWVKDATEFTFSVDSIQKDSVSYLLSGEKSDSI